MSCDNQNASEFGESISHANTDAQLIEGTLLGDGEAFATLIERHSAAVWRTVRRFLRHGADREDAVQEVFLRVYSSIGSFDPNRPLRPWIVTIARHYCIDEKRRLRRRPRQLLWTEVGQDELRQALDTLSASGSPPVQLQIGFACERFPHALAAEVGPKYYAAFVLHDLEGMSYPAIARVLGTSLATARVRVFRARRRIFDLVESRQSPETCRSRASTR